MKNLLLSLTFVCMLSISASAQLKIGPQNTYNGKIKVEKIERDAFIAEYAMTSSDMEDGLKEYFKGRKIKLENSKGVYYAKGISIAELGGGLFDIYFQTAKSDRDKTKGLLKITASTGYDNFLKASDEQFGKLKDYNNSLAVSLDAYQHKLNIEAQNDVVKKSEKKYNDAIKDQEKLEKKRQDVEKEIANNKAAQEQLLADFKNQQQLLEGLKSLNK